MDTFSFVPTAPIAHSVELYTARFLVQGVITGPFKRISDIVNLKDSSFVKVDQAVMTPMSQQTESRKLNTPIMLNKGHLHLVCAVTQDPATQQNPDTSSLTTGGLTREFYVQKTDFPCYALTNTFAIHGHSHLRRDTDLHTLLQMGETFLPLTNATITLLGRTNAPWRRELVLVNKECLEVVYGI